MQRFMEPPPNNIRTDTCYHYSELLRLVINKNSKVVSIELSDSAPVWLKRDIDRQKERKDFRFDKLDSMALKGKLRNCTLVFPLVLESVVFPCGTEAKKPNFPPNYFQFGGKNLEGNIIFGETLRFVWSTKYVVKEGTKEMPGKEPAIKQ